MELTEEVIKQTKDIETPFLFVDLDILKEKYKTLKEALGDIEIYYAMKANSDINVLKTLVGLGSKFETASVNEILLLLKLGVKPEDIVNSVPFRKEKDTKTMYDAGIRLFCYDTFAEAERVKKVAPDAKMFLRIHVENQGSDWPMPKKFGAEASDALEIIKKTREIGLEVIGITFHPGSQCRSVSNWTNSLMLVKNIFRECAQEGITLKMINLAGGIPIQHRKKIPTIKAISKAIHVYVEKNFSPIPKMMIEQGRGMVGDCGIMIAQVVSKREFKGETWLYLDIGVFTGMMETICDFDYELLTEKDLKNKGLSNSSNENGQNGNSAKPEKEEYVIAGPTCDGVDVMFKKKKITKVEVGDRVYIINAGAYTLSYAALFNGYKLPMVYYYVATGKDKKDYPDKPSCLVENYYNVS